MAKRTGVKGQEIGRGLRLPVDVRLVVPGQPAPHVQSAGRHPAHPGGDEPPGRRRAGQRGAEQVVAAAADGLPHRRQRDRRRVLAQDRLDPLGAVAGVGEPQLDGGAGDAGEVATAGGAFQHRLQVRQAPGPPAQRPGDREQRLEPGPFDAELHWPKEVAGKPMDTYHRWMEVVIGGTLAGLPVINVPAGFGPSGLPMGLQVMGKAQGDLALLQVAHAYEQAQS